jgi:hypothetical protein
MLVPFSKNSPFDTGPLKDVADVKEPTIGWLEWYGNQRLHSTLGYLPGDLERQHHPRRLQA